MDSEVEKMTSPNEPVKELKPCPFCGDKRVEFNSGYKCYRVDCGGSGPCYTDPDKALDRWNNAYCWQQSTRSERLIAELVEALNFCAKPEGAYSRDHNQHAMNCLVESIKVATEALARFKERAEE